MIADKIREAEQAEARVEAANRRLAAANQCIEQRLDEIQSLTAARRLLKRST
jgi:hypothetical protein